MQISHTLIGGKNPTLKPNPGISLTHNFCCFFENVLSLKSEA